ncbi:MAG: type IX secretion system membrane protein PorP/SprF [Candidatus Marinimicrobia bacterium]|nr:type IX secretion system membrane protein PorP/SprF [Candidatus Neomarinimicrobiota bacterium]MCF7829071.1 type IX secretion system membrane protein PorP/SprF [Candidatus Neomarinimicrobiota bacterium]MCF7881792.1 type IX secretion system membrane protein PorP/SprF [Candidatus Neomarinimicrobiota bacterium]
MIKVITTIVVGVMVVLAGFNAQGQVTSSQAYYGARNAALAGSDVAHQDDAWAVFNNPAALSGMQGLSGVFSYENTLGQSFLPHALGAVVYPMENWGSVGLGFENLAVNYVGQDLTSETAVGFYHGFDLQNDANSTLSFGYGVKYLQVDYGQSAGPSGDGSDGIDLGVSRAVGLDIGFLASLRERHYLGAKVHNINSPQMGSGNARVDLPIKLQIGAAYSPYHLVWTTFAMTREAGTETQYHAGLEYRIIDQLTLYSGVHSNPNRFGAGLRIRYKFLMADYGMITHPVFPLTHQFSLGFAL